MRILWVSALVVGLDQLTKATVLHLMYRHQSIPILGDWLKFTFTENPGMAFGIQFGPRGTVTFLSVVATLLVVYYIYQVREGYAPYRASLALILGGAIGNIIDRVFYGVLLGYDGFFAGKVVDFIHVSLWEGFIPEVVPLIGGAYMELFPIWNVADMAIVAGVVGILVFQKTFHERLYADRMTGAKEHMADPSDVTGEEEQHVSTSVPASFASSSSASSSSQRGPTMQGPGSGPDGG